MKYMCTSIYISICRTEVRPLDEVITSKNFAIEIILSKLVNYGSSEYKHYFLLLRNKTKTHCAIIRDNRYEQ
jgi:hypothetical protein